MDSLHSLLIPLKQLKQNEFFAIKRQLHFWFICPYRVSRSVSYSGRVLSFQHCGPTHRSISKIIDYPCRKRSSRLLSQELSECTITNSDDLIKPNGSPMYPRQNEFSILKFAQINWQLLIPEFAFISAQMPNITSLTIVIDSSIIQSKSLKSLFQNLSSSLVKLKLYFSVVEISMNQIIEAICTCLPLLKQLYLEISDNSLDQNEIESLLSALPPLESLYFNICSSKIRTNLFLQL